MAHAASVFYTSRFDESMIITADLTGDGKSTTLCYGSDDKISVTKRIQQARLFRHFLFNDNSISRISKR